MGGGTALKKILFIALAPSLIAVTLLAAPAAAQGSEDEPIYSTKKGPGYELYADGSIVVGGDVASSCDTVLESFLETNEEDPPRDTYRQVAICEEFGFEVPGSESLPETGGPPLPVVAALGLVLACTLCRLATRRATE